MSVRGVFAAVPIAVVLVFATSTGTAGARRSLPDNVDEALENEVALLAHVPDEVRPSCLLFDPSFNRDEPGQDFVADLECHPDSVTTITYHQYASTKDLRFDFARAGRRRGGSMCGARKTYTVDHVVQGEWMCDTDEEVGNVEIAWTFRPLAVLAFLERTDGDVDVARDMWSDQAGPDRDAHRVPAVLSPSAARRGNDELLAQIPNAAEFRCQPVDLSRSDNLLRDGPSPNLWADACWSSARTTRYRGTSPTGGTGTRPPTATPTTLGATCGTRTTEIRPAAAATRPAGRSTGRTSAGSHATSRARGPTARPTSSGPTTRTTSSPRPSFYGSRRRRRSSTGGGTRPVRSGSAPAPVRLVYLT